MRRAPLMGQPQTIISIHSCRERRRKGEFGNIRVFIGPEGQNGEPSLVQGVHYGIGSSPVHTQLPARTAAPEADSTNPPTFLQSSCCWQSRGQRWWIPCLFLKFICFLYSYFQSYFLSPLTLEVELESSKVISDPERAHDRTEGIWSSCCSEPDNQPPS